MPFLDALQGGLGRFAGILAPDPTGDPEVYRRQAQQNALLQLGLGTLGGAQQSGATLGSSLFGGLQAGQQALQQAQQNAFRSQQLKNQEDRQARLDKQETERTKILQADQARKDRERSASVGSRFSAGLDKYKNNPLAYYNVVSRDPDLQAAITAAGFDPSQITTPEQVQQVAQQLGALGMVGTEPERQQAIPADVQAYEYYSKLTPDQKKQFLEIKRNSQPYQLTDLAGGQVVFNKVTGKYEQAATPEQVATGESTVKQAASTAATVGKGVGEAQLDLQRVADNAAQARKAIADLKSAPGFDRIFGLAGAFPNFPGGEAANAQARLDQVKGKTFLEAFNSLKGAGQITETEGQKGTDAIARLQKAQSADEARLALDDLVEVIASGEARARQKASGVVRASKKDFSAMSDEDLLRAINE